MLSRRAVPLFIVPALIATVLACLGAPASAHPAAAQKLAGKRITICAQHHYRIVTSAAGRHYVVENGNFGGKPECITNRGLRPNFEITKSGARTAGFEPVAYPFALYGCSWGLCTPGTKLPARLSRVRHATASWHIGARARGRWNAAFDVWFGRHRGAYKGQARGAELMIWLNARHYPAGQARVIRVDHRRWYVYHWVTAHNGARWNYIQVRAVRATSHVSNLALLPIIRKVERMGLIRPWWWMLNIESGFEIWRGGTGLQTRYFAAGVTLKKKR
jgi:Glycosyl hydrolase family 12